MHNIYIHIHVYVKLIWILIRHHLCIYAMHLHEELEISLSFLTAMRVSGILQAVPKNFTFFHLSIVWRNYWVKDKFNVSIWITPTQFNFFVSPFPQPTTFSPTPMLMTSLFTVPSLTLIRRLRPFLPIHQIQKSG